MICEDPRNDLDFYVDQDLECCHIRLCYGNKIQVQSEIEGLFATEITYGTCPSRVFVLYNVCHLLSTDD